MEKWEALKANPMIQVRQLRQYEHEKFTPMADKLAHQLSRHGGGGVTQNSFFNSVGQDEDNFTVFIVRHVDQPEGEFIGTATVFFRDLFLSGWIAEIHDVVVDEEKYRRQGYGRLLTQHIFDCVKTRAEKLGKPIKLMLTSAPQREEANAMYLKMGFTLIAEATKYVKITAVGNVNEYVEGATNLYQKIFHP